MPQGVIAKARPEARRVAMHHNAASTGCVEWLKKGIKIDGEVDGDCGTVEVGEERNSPNGTFHLRLVDVFFVEPFTHLPGKYRTSAPHPHAFWFQVLGKWSLVLVEGVIEGANMKK